MTRCYSSSKPDKWTTPRPHTDPSLRLHTYVPVRPMDERTADPVDWFHVILRLAMIGATAGVVAYAMGWLS